MNERTDLIAGRYRLIAQVGNGGMGVVWRAQDELLGRTVALKELMVAAEGGQRAEDAGAADGGAGSGGGSNGDEAETRADGSSAGSGANSGATSQAIREARIAARLHHPNVIGVFDVAEHEGRPFLIMEFLASRSLADMLAVGVILPAVEVAVIGAKLASALVAAHDVGIVHRDVKPGNVLLSDAGIVKLTDFGISRVTGDTATATGTLMGTPAYLAPEVARGRPADSRSDVYSLGATLYTAIEGKPPFGDDEDAMALLYRVTHDEITPARNAGPLTDVLMSMLERDPSRRPTMPAAQRILEGIADAIKNGRATARTVPVTVAPVAVLAPSPPTPSPTPQPQPLPLSSMSPSIAPQDEVAEPEPLIPAAAVASASSTQRKRWKQPSVLAGLLLAALLAAGTIAVVASGGDHAAVAAPKPTAVVPSASASHPAASPKSGAAIPSAAGATSAAGGAATSAAAKPPAAPTTPAPATTPPPSVAPVAASAPGSQDVAAQLTATIVDYYRIVPGDLDQGWGWMSPDYQQNHAGGRSGYDAFWKQVQRVVASDVVATLPSTVTATIDYYGKDGHVTEERTTYGLISDQGRWKIASSSVLSSRQIS